MGAQRGRHIIRRVVLAALLGVTIWCSWRLYQLETERGRMKADLKEITHVTYGLFNVDAWRDVMVHIITRKVQALHVSPANREELKAHIEKIMYDLLDEMQAVVERRNKRSGFSGVMRQMIMDIFVDIKTIRSGVPRYADLMIDYVNDPKNRGELTGMVLQQFDALADKTVGKVDYTSYNIIMERWDCSDPAICATVLKARIAIWLTYSQIHMWVLLAAAIATGVIVFLPGARHVYDLLFLVGVAIFLLITGVSLPMIDIEATISDFSFTLLGEPVSFKDQVLFYQSKSILQVVHVLIADGGFGLVLVGVLVLLFSVLVPFSKIIASLITLHRGTSPKRKFHHYLVFRAGKWSMADVMVVAIFMAFIGFSGIVRNQLEQLSAASTRVEILTTNNSDLQIGFYLFLAYCIAGLLLGVRIERLLKAKRIGPGST